MWLWIAIHLMAATFWVGGMYFAHRCLRPAAEVHLEAPQRLLLWRGVLRRFFSRLWTAIAALLISGYLMVFIYLGGLGAVSLHVHLMQLSGILMVLLYLYVYFEPYRRLKSALDDGDYEAAAGHLARVRRVVGVNIILGVLTMLLGATGRYWTL